ncbi:hypothetical protein GOV09_01340 [Candidatus Woesearchaeota archaeon]|nr:hypothetical protein [Candidatus Woesearchaeota archaeon]
MKKKKMSQEEREKIIADLRKGVKDAAESLSEIEALYQKVAEDIRIVDEIAEETEQSEKDF